MINKAVVSDDTLIIEGSGFGTGPHIVVYDNFERGVDGQSIPAGPAVIGGWGGIGVNAPKFGKGVGVTGSGYLKATYASTWQEFMLAKLAGVTDVFISYFWRVPEGKKFPGEGSVDTLNWKLVWLQDTGTTDGDLALPVTVGDPPGQGWLIDGNGSPYGKWFTSPELPLKGRWHHFQFYVKASPTNGALDMFETTSIGLIKRISERKATVYQGDTWNRVQVPGYGRSFPGQEVNMDEVYIADGINCQSRIMLGNNPIYEKSSQLLVLPSTSWTDGKIVTQKPSGLEYVTFIDNSGIPINTVKIGGTVIIPPPPPPVPPQTEIYPFVVQVAPTVVIKGQVEITK